ncbi:flagellin [Campylobacter curvus]|uniref:flagellin N-terminal helical domain-containing protein n=1 Tax=Campylobacter curvus TaxID=200 RepID=UPI00147076EE|nr:flagellin [Campylobacter curvus]
MRITNQLRFSQTLHDYQNSMAGVNKSYRQMSSGLKIQNPYENASVYNDAMRLDYEAETLSQVVEATSKSVNFSKNTDKSLQEFEKQLENFKTKVVQAASDVHSKTSLEALANELQGIKNHLVNIANTSINGQFLFSGSAVDTKPIDGNGKYQGNRDHMKTSAGAQIELPYNIPGHDLFLGKDNDYSKILTTNVSLTDNTKTDVSENPKYLTAQSKIKNMIGLNYTNDSKNVDNQGKYAGSINPDYDFLDSSNINFPDTYFYMQGKKPDGTSFTSKFKMTAGASVESLMEKIGQEFGNTATTKVVDVSINNDGQFNIKDLTKGNQVIDFHMVAATSTAANKNAIAPNNALDGVNTLADLETMASANPKTVHITEFTKSKFKDKDGNTVNSFDFDRVRFDKKDNKITGTISQVVRKSGEYATDSTRLSEVAGTDKLYPKEQGKYNIDDRKLTMEIVSRNGTKYKVDIDLGHEEDLTATPPVAAQTAKFTISGTTSAGTPIAAQTFDIWHATEYGQFKTPTKDVTFRQINDIISMAASDNIPTANTYDNYNSAISLSKGAVEVNMNEKGKIELTDKTNAVSTIQVAAYDSTTNSDKFYGDSTGTTAATSQGKGSVFSFSENNAITIDEPSVNIFDDLDKMIEAVRQGYYRSNAENGDPRNTGMQGALERLDHLIDHANKELTKVGSQTKLITSTNERASLMKVNVLTVKNEVIDADYAEAYLNFTQKTLSYQAMLQASAKINQLSLLNYL